MLPEPRTPVIAPGELSRNGLLMIAAGLGYGDRTSEPTELAGSPCTWTNGVSLDIEGRHLDGVSSRNAILATLRLLRRSDASRDDPESVRRANGAYAKILGARAPGYRTLAGLNCCIFGFLSCRSIRRMNERSPASSETGGVCDRSATGIERTACATTIFPPFS